MTLSRLFHDTRLENMNDLEFNLSKPLEVTFNGTFGLPVCDVLLVFNSNRIALSIRLAVIGT